MDTPKSDAAIDLWPDYSNAVRQRLEIGKRAYGDSSFERPLDRLITEIQEEIMDVSGWAFILYTRLEKLREAINTIAAA